MAFWAWAKGDLSGNLSPKRIYNKAHPIVVDSKDIPGIMAEYGQLLQVWKDYKTFGLPHPGGYMQQPALWVAVVRLVENESAEWQEELRGDIGRAKNSR